MPGSCMCPHGAVRSGSSDQRNSADWSPAQRVQPLTPDPWCLLVDPELARDCTCARSWLRTLHFTSSRCHLARRPWLFGCFCSRSKASNDNDNCVPGKLNQERSSHASRIVSSKKKPSFGFLLALSSGGPRTQLCSMHAFSAWCGFPPGVSDIHTTAWRVQSGCYRRSSHCESTTRASGRTGLQQTPRQLANTEREYQTITAPESDPAQRAQSAWTPWPDGKHRAHRQKWKESSEVWSRFCV